LLKKSLLALAVAAAFGLGSDAKAALLFSFSSAASVPAGGVDVQPTTTVTYSGNTGGSDADGPGADIKLSFIDLTAPTGPGPIASPFTFDITITDLTTSAVGVFTLSGSLSGSVTPDSSTITFTFAGSDAQNLGGTVYTVTAKFVDVPTVETGGVTKQGSITAHVTAEAAGVPEPTTVALAALGVPFALVCLRRRGRKAS
jgi:hypothetical protein